MGPTESSNRRASDPKRVVAGGYDRLGSAFSAWIARNPHEVREWFLSEVVTWCLHRTSDRGDQPHPSR